MGDNDFPTVMANGGGKPFLQSYVKKRQSYQQEGTDIPDFSIEDEYEKESGKPTVRKTIIRK